MADTKLSTVVGGGSLPKLAPDLTFPSSLAANAPYKEVTGIDATLGLTTLLNLSGKHAINFLQIQSLTAENVTVKLTIDGVVIWNDSFALAGISIDLLGNNGADATSADSIECSSSLLLELQTTTDTSATFRWLSRPIL